MREHARPGPRDVARAYGAYERRGRLPARRYGKSSGSGWTIALWGVGLLAAVAVAANAKDLYRYIKIARM